MKHLIRWSLACFVLMIGFPWLVATLAGDAGMFACLVLFFAVNPVFCVLCGVAAGKDLRKLWPLPIIASTLFLAGAWIFFEMGEPAFLLYGGIYLGISSLTMLLVAFWHRHR